MVKYLNILACSALAMFIASPASAEIINLYDLRNFLYYGSTNLGKGIDGESDPFVPSCDASQGEFDSPPSNMTCQSVNKGSITCYRNCSCSSEFKYDDTNCPSAQRFVRSNQTCNGLSNSCSCSDDALNPIDLAVVKSAFDGVDSYTSLDGSVTCNYLTNPYCKTGEQYSYAVVNNVVGSSFSHSEYYVSVNGKDEPITHDLVASTKTQTSGTVYCLTKTYVNSKFKNAVSLSNDFNVNCAKVSTAYTKLNNLPYYYLDGSCNTTDGNLCNLASASATATASFDFYRPGDTGLKSTSCEYVTAPACAIGYGVSSMDYATARERYSSLRYIDISVSEPSNGNACVTFNGCKNGAVPFDNTNGINFATVNASGMVDKVRLDSRLASLIPNKTFESEVSYISYPDDVSDTSLVGKSTLYFCYKETGCKVPEDDASIACYVDSELITALNKPAGSVGYTASASDTCDGVKLLHPISINSAICLPTSCGKFVTDPTGSNTMGSILHANGLVVKGGSTLSELRTMLNTYVCPYGLCNADAILGDAKSNGYVIGNDKTYSYVVGQAPILVSSDTAQIQSGNYIHVKCKQMPVLQGATKALADCEVGDYIKLPQNDNPAVCSSTPLDKSRNIIVDKDSSLIAYISENNISNEIKLIDKKGSPMSATNAYSYLEDNAKCTPLSILTFTNKNNNILSRLVSKFVSDNNITSSPVHFYLGGGTSNLAFYRFNNSTFVNDRPTTVTATTDLYYVCAGYLSIK